LSRIFFYYTPHILPKIYVLAKDLSMKYISMILIDPQVGFCSSSGSLGLKYGSEELSEIRKVIPNIKTGMDYSYRRHIVKSEYVVGQFTDGDTEHALANLCVPQVNDDCHVIEELSSISYHSFTTKRQQSALSFSDFGSEIEQDFETGITRFVIAGFLLDHCVKATAEDLCLKLSGSGAEVYVCSDLSATRLEKYTKGIVASTIEALNDKGVKYRSWQSIQS
jgi:nicotinamidase-related amidase